MSESQESALPFVPLIPSTASEFYVHVPRSDEPKEVDPLPAVSLAPPDIQCAGYFRIKSVIDRLLTIVLMTVAVPVMLVVGLAILLLDGRPVFYRQRRTGKQGREFWIWKFRTMRPDAERMTGAVWSSAADPRITPLGRWLRFSHLDELPQFFNILMGDMNLVGPRPERPEFVAELAKEIAGYMQRVSVRPGITGLAQIEVGYDNSVADVEKKVQLDLKYIQSATLRRDLSLLLKTLPHIAKKLIAKSRFSFHARQASTKQSESDQVSDRLVAAKTWRESRGPRPLWASRRPEPRRTCESCAGVGKGHRFVADEIMQPGKDQCA